MSNLIHRDSRTGEVVRIDKPGTLQHYEEQAYGVGTPPKVAPLGGCQWFSLCENEATHLEPHSVLGQVPTCDRCGRWLDSLDPDRREYFNTAKPITFQGS